MLTTDDPAIRSEALALVVAACRLAVACGCTWDEIDGELFKDYGTLTVEQLGQRSPDAGSVVAKAHHAVAVANWTRHLLNLKGD